MRAVYAGYVLCLCWLSWLHICDVYAGRLPMLATFTGWLCWMCWLEILSMLPAYVGYTVWIGWMEFLWLCC